MDKGGVNIDIVFRNGLRDFEVLPPPEVWDNIHPVIKIKRRPVVLLRTAALIAIILSLSFFSYILSRKLSTGPESTVLAVNMNVASPVYRPDPAKPVTDIQEIRKFPQDSQIAIVEEVKETTRIDVIDKLIAPAIAILHKTKSLSLIPDDPLLRSFLPAYITSNEYIPVINELDQQYLPMNGTTKDSEKWSVAAIASPTYNSRVNSGSDNLNQQLMASEEKLTSYSGGVAFSYKVNKRLSIQSGLFYSTVGQLVDGINSFSGFQRYDITKGDRNFEVLTTRGTIYTNNGDVFLISTRPDDRVTTASAYTNDAFDPNKASLQYLNSTIRQNFSYLELPFMLRYKFIDKKIDFNLIGGVSYNMLVSNSVFTIVDGSKYSIGKTDGLNPVSLSSSFGMGMEYNFSAKLSLNLEPTFRYYLNPYSRVVGSAIHPYSFGIFSGVSYKF
jgi:hypothetical protein